MVSLIPMSQEEFDAYLRRATPEYAQDHVRSGDWHPDDALAKAKAQYRELLPEGLATENQHLFTIRDLERGVSVGMLWFAVEDRPVGRQAFLYEFWIDEAFRRQGYGTAALHVLEDQARSLGAGAIRLHVFGHNASARALYEKVGYEATNVLMAKRLQ